MKNIDTNCDKLVRKRDSIRDEVYGLQIMFLALVLLMSLDSVVNDNPFYHYLNGGGGFVEFNFNFIVICSCDMQENFTWS